MIKKFISVIILVLLCTGLVAESKAEQEIEYVPMIATGYCLTSPRCDGGKTREGICAVKDKSHYGDVAYVYERNEDNTLGEFICMVECLDYCPKKNVIDIWHKSASECVTRKVFVIYRKGKG